jgi:hypothetical protein
MRFFIASRGQASGPFTPDEIVQRIQSRELAGTDEVWLEGTPEAVTVSQLLRGRSHTDADLQLLDELRGKAQPSSPLPRRYRRTVTPIQILAVLPSFGMAGTSMGGGLLALFCIGMYVWGTLEMNSQGRRERQFDDLRQKIVQHVNSQPEVGAMSLDQLQRSAVLTPDDLELIEKVGAEYHAIAADSPGEAPLFTRVGRNTERRYYKNGEEDFTIWWISPDEQFKVVSAPQTIASRSRALRIVHLPTGRVLAKYETDVHSLSAEWRPDSRAVAIDESCYGRPQRLALWQVTAQSARRLTLPAELNPRQLIRPEDQVRAVRWNTDQVRAEQWLAGGDLMVESCCGLSLSSNRFQPDGSVYARRRFVLRIEEDGTVSMVRAEELGYYKTEPQQPAHR